MPESHSPWDTSNQAGDVVWRGTWADATTARGAVDAMAAAFPSWRASPDKTARLRRFAEVIGNAQERLVALLIREAGKVRADAVAEAALLVKKITVTIDVGLARTPTAITAERLASQPIVWRPRGVAVVLGPFNFPLHLLHGLVVPALAVGCTVVAKPSERCPALATLYAELIAAAGLTDICRIVLGDADTARALIADPRVATVAAVGGRAMGVGLASALATRPETVLALELGGVNHALVCADADETAAVAMVADGAWTMAGQRCTATRIVQVPRARLDWWLHELSAARAAYVPTGSVDARVGPMISGDVRERFQHPYRALPDGMRLVAGDVQGEGAFAEPLLLCVDSHAARAHPLYTDEQFGPALIVDAYDSLDQAIARAQANPYRLACSVFTRDSAAFPALAAQLPYGQVNLNRPTAGARSDLPFGGCGRSGNGRPAALAAGAIFADECVVWT